ncbi:hypothetical protein J6590_071723 [Homalodisca vitripennis]|nr:hypothetical protein J6590_071723 [Homalodisca vitripennis]
MEGGYLIHNYNKPQLNSLLATPSASCKSSNTPAATLDTTRNQKLIKFAGRGPDTFPGCFSISLEQSASTIPGKKKRKNGTCNQEEKKTLMEKKQINKLLFYCA